MTSLISKSWQALPTLLGKLFHEPFDVLVNIEQSGVCGVGEALMTADSCGVNTAILSCQWNGSNCGEGKKGAKLPLGS